MKAVTVRAKTGFETAILVPGEYASFQVQALSADGRTIGTSRPFAARS